ncbi:hypothetical protein [Gemmobacter serpentinus]|uniref:hypothetical protein n=1 Tax=Gemmobacter serpentinus TaxID=2652247 RepID=UPI00124D3A8E|nr:hypothetical protein [Gemmobacter serpentinus]
MADQDFNEFYARVARVEKARAKGYGFEADGTLGRSHYQRPARRRKRFLAPLLVTLGVFFCLKGTLMYQIGQHVYGERVTQMRAAESGMERVAGSIMQADPVTIWIAARIEQALRP